MDSFLTTALRLMSAASPILLAASVSIASPAFDEGWSWLDSACAALDLEPLARIEETGTRETVGPEHLPAITAMIAARQACRNESLVAGLRSFDVDPRAHVQRHTQ
jgi:hypothetical protein